MCFMITSFKRTWDVSNRTDEAGTPPCDRSCTVSVAICLLFYVPLNVWITLRPSWRSSTCELVKFPGGPVELVVAIVGAVYVVAALASIPVLLPEVDTVGETGEFLIEKSVMQDEEAESEYETESC